jgi:hypothetical protein
VVRLLVMMMVTVAAAIFSVNQVSFFDVTTLTGER